MENIIDLKGLAKQLSCPDGEHGTEVGENMNTSNIGMTKKTIDALMLKDKEQVLELGHGNCKHLDYVLDKANNLGYIGLEVSETMMKDALFNNSSYLNTDTRFELFDGQYIHFHEKRFDKIFTVNTLYFWKEPIFYLNEIYRVLKFNGLFALTFAKKEFMETLPFTQYGFNLYTEEEVIKLLKSVRFTLESVKTYKENVLSKIGEQVEREFVVVIVSK